MTRRKAVVEISFAAAIWGFGFIATRYMLEAAKPIQAMVWRFVLAAAFAFVWMAFLPQAKRRKAWSLVQKDMGLAFFPGAFLAATLVFQAMGLALTSVANNSFLTCLYIVFVPLLQAFVLRQRVGASVWFCIGLALAGAALMCGVGAAGLSSLNRGDLLTILCAVTCSFHIVWVDRYVTRIEHAFWFNVAQSFWAGVCLIPFAYMFEGGLAASGLWTEPRALGGMIFLATASTLLAFMLQIRSQRVLPPALASMLFLMEGPFATVFAFLLLGETTSPTQMGGAALVLSACILVVRLSRAK